MKAHRRIRRALRSLALTGCLCALLATPTVAGAMPLKDGTAAQSNAPTLLHQHGRPAAQSLYKPSSSFKPEVTTQAPAKSAPYSPSSSFKPEVTTQAPANSTPATSPTVVVRNIGGDSDHTLAIVLASAALGVALCGTAYGAFRLVRIQRRVVGIDS